MLPTSSPSSATHAPGTAPPRSRQGTPTICSIKGWVGVCIVGLRGESEPAAPPHRRRSARRGRRRGGGCSHDKHSNETDYTDDRLERQRHETPDISSVQQNCWEYCASIAVPDLKCQNASGTDHHSNLPAVSGSFYYPWTSRVDIHRVNPVPIKCLVIFYPVIQQECLINRHRRNDHEQFERVNHDRTRTWV